MIAEDVTPSPSFARSMQILACVLVVGFIGLVLLGRTSDEDFVRNTRLHLTASDHYDKSQIVFQIEFSTVGDTVWPPWFSKLVLYADGKKTPFPVVEWSRSVVTDHILRDYPRAALWWMTLEEVKKWIGVGEHELQVQFRSVKSNVLRVRVPVEGQMKCNPELEQPTWKKVR